MRRETVYPKSLVNLLRRLLKTIRLGLHIGACGHPVLQMAMTSAVDSGTLLGT